MTTSVFDEPTVKSCEVVATGCAELLTVEVDFVSDHDRIAARQAH